MNPLSFFTRLVAGLAMLCALAAPALAHAQLLSSEPASNRIVQEAPETIALKFNEAVSPLSITLIDPMGQKTDLTGQSLGGETVTVSLPQNLGTGTHVLSWRVASIDGHPVGSALVFSVRAATTPASAPEADRATAIALWASKALLFIALFIGLGGVFFRLVAPVPRKLEEIMIGMVSGGLVLAPLSLGLHGLDALGQPLTGLSSLAPWQAGFSTSYGVTVLVLVAGFVLGLLAMRLKGLVARGFGIIAVLLGALSLSLSGHAGASEPQWLTRPAVFLHIASILFWVGALVPLFVLLSRRTDDADRALRQFSRVIPVPVAALVLSGATLATIQMGAPGAAWLSPYGYILGAKLLLLLGLFALALSNRLWLTEPALAGATGSRKQLRRSIFVEIFIVVVILGLAASWRFTPPPRALAEMPLAEPIHVHAMNSAVMADATLTGAPGSAGLTIRLTDINYGAIEAQSVTAILSSETLGIAPIRRDAEETDGEWVVGDLAVPLAGQWTLTLEIRLTRFSLAKIAADFEVP